MKKVIMTFGYGSLTIGKNCFVSRVLSVSTNYC